MGAKFTETIYLDGVPFEVGCFYYPGENQTYWEPMSPDEVEVDSISFCNIPFTTFQRNSFIDYYGEKEFEEWMMEEAKNIIQQEREERAAYLYEQMMDEKKGYYY